MASALRSLLGGKSDPANAGQALDSDFADFAGPADPAPATPPSFLDDAPLAATVTARPYMAWWAVHERHSLSEFYAEALILIGILVLIGFHLYGSRLNRRKARAWLLWHARPLAAEFALVGFSGVPNSAEILPAEEESQAQAQVAQALEDEGAMAQATEYVKEKSLFEFTTYASGRQNVAFLDAKLTLIKRFNPILLFSRQVLGFVLESFARQDDMVEVTMCPFDGRESLVVPQVPGMAEARQAKDQNGGGKNVSSSTYDGFVWAVVNKGQMKELRDDRYDLSLTYTKDHQKLPNWLSIMSESAEITDMLLTRELAEAITKVGPLFDYLIISDQPAEKPMTIEETSPRKGLSLRYRLPADDNYEPMLPLFKHFVRIPDRLVQAAHLRPEVLRKIKATRDTAVKAIKKRMEEEKAEERATEREKARKEKRNRDLDSLDAKAQKKYLEKERERGVRRAQKRATVRA